MGYYTKFRDKVGQFRFNLKAANHEIILSSEGYLTSQSCDNGIASVRVNSPLDHRYDRLRSKDDKYYFNLKGGNGEVIGTSETYNSAAAMEVGISSVKVNAPNAEVKDLTKVAV